MFLKLYLNKAVHGQSESKLLTDYIESIKSCIFIQDDNNHKVEDFKCKIVLIDEIIDENLIKFEKTGIRKWKGKNKCKLILEVQDLEQRLH